MIKKRQSDAPPLGQIDFGDLRRVVPISRSFGFDRGTPVDRYYIEDFLARHAADVRGRALEIGDDEYTRRFGTDRVTHSDVLHVEPGNPKATIVADLTNAAHIPADTFDTVILTQTLHLIYDVSAALRTVWRILRPGGVLLATFPGISQVSEREWASTWFWSFTEWSARRLFGEVFGSANIRIETHGNVLAAGAFLNGIAAEELLPEELGHIDRCYPVTIAVAAVKQADKPASAHVAVDGWSGGLAADDPRPPLVTVIMPFFNAQAFMPQAVESVLHQSYPNWELLLVDDGSTDESTAYAQHLRVKFPDRVRYLEHDGHQNRGISATRNLGIRNARGELIAFLDADDVWLPHKLERQVDLMSAQPVDLLFGLPLYWHSWSGRSEDACRDHIPDVGFSTGRLMRPAELSLLSYPLGEGNAPSMSDFIARRELLDEVGGFEESFRGMYEDQAFMAKVYLSANVFVSAECWSKYRFHDQSCSARSAQRGDYRGVRLQFLEWFESYLAGRYAPPAVRRALRKALRSYRQPRLHSVAERAARLAHVTASAAGRLLPRRSERSDEIDKWRRLANLRERLLNEQRAWVREVEAGKSWLEGQAINWERTAREREEMLEEQRAWSAKLEQGKAWLEAQWHNWEAIAQDKQNEIERLAAKLAEVESETSAAKPNPD